MAFIYLSSQSVEVKRVSDAIGFGVFCGNSTSAGTRIYQDRPLVSIQHTANRRFIKACHNCHIPLGSLREKMATILDESRFTHVDLSSLPGDGNPMVNCDCGELYCSAGCGAEAFKNHHYCLCVSRTGEHGQAISDFKFFCLSVDGCGDNLLLLAQLLAVAASKAEGSFVAFESVLNQLLTYTNRPFHEVARPSTGAQRDDSWNRWLESTISEAFELLSCALAPQSEVFRIFFANKLAAFSILSRLLSVFELNNIDIAIPSSMDEQMKSLHAKGVSILPIVREKEVVMRLLWNDEARGIYEDEEEEEDVDYESEEMECVDEDGDCCESHHDEEYVDEMVAAIREEVGQMSIDDLLASEYPNFHGTGFFGSVARTNHSCDPNVVMDFDDNNAVVSCKALRDIEAGEELRMSYIARPESKPRKLRQAQLNDYLFECTCTRCILDN